MTRLFPVLFFVVVLSGCASTGGSFEELAVVTPHANAVDLSDRTIVRRLLQQQYAEWQGTPHRMGGVSHNGVDCSGLVQQTFLSRFGLELPRTTRYQAAVGRAIDRSELRPGDLVFFKTGYKTRHVGIYKGESQFLHASSSEGVTTSDLNNPYWASNYWQSRRIGLE